MNIPLFSAMFTIAFTVIVGVLMIVVIVLDQVTAATMWGAAGLGTLISIPVALLVSKKLSSLTGK